MHEIQNTKPATRQPVRFRLIDKDGRICGTFRCASQATFEAERLWPSQERDEDREGRGWDIEPIR